MHTLHILQMPNMSLGYDLSYLSHRLYILFVTYICRSIKNIYRLIPNFTLPDWLPFSFTDLPPTEPSEFAGICPLDQYNPVSSRNSVWLPYRGHCYKFVTEMKRWADAAASCQKHGEFKLFTPLLQNCTERWGSRRPSRPGASLASIEDPSEQKFIQDNVKMFEDVFHVFWIGLFRSGKGTVILLDRDFLVVVFIYILEIFF